MIRLIQRRLIIPRGDTGSFTIPVIKPSNENVAVFTIFDDLTHTRLFQKRLTSEGDVLNIAFTHNETVNLKPGKYFWDIKYYSNPLFVEDELVDGDEVDSYYAGYSLPVCEIRPTGDDYLVSNDAPSATLAPDQLDIITNAITALNEAVEKTQTNVEHYPAIRDETWYVWDAESNDYVSTEVSANGIVGNGIASAVLNDDYSLTLNFTDGTSFTSPSIRGETGNGIDDIVLNNDFTLTISYTDGESYTTPSIRGPVGATPQFNIGTVQDGAVAAASVTGTAENPVLNLTLPNAHVPTRVSQLENDAGYLTEHQDLSDYVQKTDYATSSNAGIIIPNNTSLRMVGSTLGLMGANSSRIKSGTDASYPIMPNKEHESTFYGLAKAAGDSTQSTSDNAVGTYTDDAKAAIQTMLDVPSNSDIPTQVSELTNDAGYLTAETDPTVPAWAKAAQKPTYTASEVGAPTVAEMNTAIGTAIGNINSFDIVVVQTLPTQDISTHTIYLVPKTGETNDVYDEYVYINNNWEMVGNTQIDLSNYATKDELPDVPVQDVQVNGTSIVSNGTANIPPADNLNFGTVKVAGEAYGISISGTGFLNLAKATDSQVIYGNNNYRAIVPSIQHASVFYGLAKAASDSTQIQSNNAVGQYTDEAKTAIQTMLDVPAKSDIPEVPVQDVQINGVSVLNDGVANVPIANSSTYGVIKINDRGLGINPSGILVLGRPTDNEIKAGEVARIAIDPAKQHQSTFYGLAKAAGADMKDIANTTVGVYPDAQKAAIQSMLGISQMLAPENPNLVATQAYAIGDVFAANGHLYKAIAAIAQDEAIIPDTNCVETTMADAGGKIKDVQVAGTSVVGNDGIASVPVASTNALGVVRPRNGFGISVDSAGQIYTVKPNDTEIKAGTHQYNSIVPYNQHTATFYGLSKIAGVDLANETVTLGTYPETSKTAIKEMLGVQDGLKVVRLI